MNGFINLYKPSGVSSAGVLNAVKKTFKGYKVGHMGTLDPMAHGVLPIAIGKSTRLFDYLLDKEKVYSAIFTFGYQTDTLDREGKVIFDGGVVPTIEEVRSVIPKLLGKINQVPPSFSAKNVNGKRSYELARKGEIINLPPKEVEILDIKVDDCDEKNSYAFTITCKGGTYIRSICRDIATMLNTYATMTMLRRDKSGAFEISRSVTADKINKETANQLLIKPDSVLTFEKVELPNNLYEDLINGRPCAKGLKDGLYSVYGKGEFIGVASSQKGNLKIKSYIKD